MYTAEQVEVLVDKGLDVAFKKFQEDKLQDSEIITKQVLKVDPKNVRGLQLMGLIRHAQKQWEKGIEYFSEALAIDDTNAENHNNISLCYANVGKFNEAITHMEKAIDLKPDCAFMRSNLGLQHRQNQNVEEAIKHFRKALEMEEEAHTWGMLGGCYGELHQLDKAQECFENALRLDPDFAGAHVDLATVYKLRGDWAKAWPEYEWRFKVYDQTKYWLKLYDPAKRWDGKQPLDGKKILVHSEQGAGDCIHFFRYVPLIKQMGAHVIVHCWENLASLFAPRVDEVYTVNPGMIPPFDQRGKDFGVPEHDWVCSMISLPYLLGNPPIPSPPYLSTKLTLDTSDYKDYFKIGIVWGGNPQHPNDALRSVRLSRFKPIHDLPGVKLFSLQYDIRPRAYRFMPGPVDLTEGAKDMKIVDMAEHMKDFEQTAAIVNAMDLLITVDTAVLHLAGALDRPAWGLIPWNMDWRWMVEGETTVWYPSIRLFRQPKKDDWDSVFHNVLQALKERLK